MSRQIAVHVVAGILFAAVGTTNAQESVPRPAVVEARDTPTSTVLPTGNDSSSSQNDGLEPRAPFRFDCLFGIEGDVAGDPDDNIAGLQDSAPSSQNASDSPRAKTSTTRRWFADAGLKILEFLARGLVKMSER